MDGSLSAAGAPANRYNLSFARWRAGFAQEAGTTASQDSPDWPRRISGLGSWQQLRRETLMPSLEVDGYPVSYAEAGSGAPLLMIHGTLGDQRSFGPQMAAFGAKYHVMSLSMRHAWPGTWEEGGNFTIDRHVEDVAGFIKALGAGPVYLLGHSRGGHIAFRVAERYPELIKALVLAEPGGELDDSLGGAPASGKQAAGFSAAAEKIGAGDFDGGLIVVAEQTGGPGAWDKRPEEKKVIGRDNARPCCSAARTASRTSRRSSMR
jgi:esterase